MKYIIPTFIEMLTNHKQNFTISEHYEAKCPFCNDKNWIWTSEYDSRKSLEHDKCGHYSRISKNGKIVFKKEPKIELIPYTASKNKIVIDSIDFYYDDYESLVYALEDFIDSPDHSELQYHHFLSKISTKKIYYIIEILKRKIK